MTTKGENPGGGDMGAQGGIRMREKKGDSSWKVTSVVIM